MFCHQESAAEIIWWDNVRWVWGWGRTSQLKSLIFCWVILAGRDLAFSCSRMTPSSLDRCWTFCNYSLIQMVRLLTIEVCSYGLRTITADHSEICGHIQYISINTTIYAAYNVEYGSLQECDPVVFSEKLKIFLSSEDLWQITVL